VTTEPIETLYEIMESERFGIQMLEGFGPLGPDIDRVCYHLHEDLDDDGRHEDIDELDKALRAAGVIIDRWGLADYPWEIWEKRWPTNDWVEHDIPIIFEVLNRFNHGLYGISYEPRGAAAWHLRSAAFWARYNALDPAERPSGYEQEDLSRKAAGVVFLVKLAEAVYAHVAAGKLTAIDAINRMERVMPLTKKRWPNRLAETISSLSIFAPVATYGSEHEKLKDWAVEQVLNGPSEEVIH
jgi:hypothetical protein